jgi:hypothetical protein
MFPPHLVLAFYFQLALLLKNKCSHAFFFLENLELNLMFSFFFFRFAVCVEGLADFFYGYLDKDADGEFFLIIVFFLRHLTSTLTVKSSWCSSCYTTLNPRHILSLSLSLSLSL